MEKSAKPSKEVDFIAPWGAGDVPAEALQVRVRVRVPKWGTLPEIYHSYGIADLDDPLTNLNGATAVVKSFTVMSPPLGLDFFGLFDGILGSKFAKHMEERLHVAVAGEIERTLRAEALAPRTGDGGDAPRTRDDVEGWWRTVIVDAFRAVDDEVVAAGGSDIDAPALVFSGALVALVLEDYFVLTNRGFSGAVIYRGNEAVQLIPEHTPVPQNAGGDVLRSTSRVEDGSSKCRADVPEPEVLTVKRKPEDKFLILATRGVWDYLTPENACSYVEERLLKPRVFLPWEKRPVDGSRVHCPHAIAYKLAMHAQSKGSRGNLTILVILIKKFWHETGESSGP